MSAVTFVHLTDLHVNAPGKVDPGLLCDTTATLETVVSMVNAITPAPAFVLVSGDLTNHGDEESYRHLRSILAGIGAPLVLALGNHDTRPGFYSAMLDRTEDPGAPYCHDEAITGVHLITLDSSVPGKVGGALTPDQFEFLDAALSRHPDLPKLLMVHHAPALDEEMELGWECLDFADSRRLAETIKDRGMAGIFSGHVHFDRVAHWHGIPVIVGTGLHNSTDVLYPHGLRVVTGAGFAVCALRPSGLTVSFVPLPSERRELTVHSREQLEQFSRL